MSIRAIILLFRLVEINLILDGIAELQAPRVFKHITPV